MKEKQIFDNTVAAEAKCFILRMASSVYFMARIFVMQFLMLDEKVLLYTET